MHYFNDFTVSTARICMMGCMTDIFNYYKLGVNESIIFALSNASLFYYEQHTCSKKNSRFSVTLGGMQDIPIIIENITHFFGVKILQQFGYDVLDTKEFINSCVNKGLPVFSLLSTEHLEYTKENTQFMGHAVYLTGYDWGKNQLYINDTTDGFLKSNCYSGWICFDSYHNSLVSSNKMFKKNLSFRNLAFIPQNSKPFSEYQLSLKTEVLKKISNNFFAKRILGEKIKTGLNAYSQFLEDYKIWMNEAATPELLDLMKFIHQKLTVFGGPAITNQILAEYVDYLNNNCGCKYENLKNKFSKLSEQWLIISSMFLKASLGKMEQIKMSLYERLKNAIKLEENIYTEIMQKIKNQ